MGWLTVSLKAAIASSFVLMSSTAWAGDTVLDKIKADPTLSTLADLIEIAGLDDDLASEGPVTIFAPTNEAFEMLPDGVLDSLSDPSGSEKLKSLLTRHVVPAKLMIDPGMETERDLSTLSGETIYFAIDSEFKTVEDAEIVISNIRGSNGVIHVIGEVIEMGTATDDYDYDDTEADAEEPYSD